MKFVELPLKDSFLVEPERHTDARGYFARTFCADEFAAHGLASALVQCSTSFNVRRGTLRGMHFQKAPYEEEKLVRCTRGAVFDVVLDLRPDSATFRQWRSFELSVQNGCALYVPKGFAHGFQALTDDAEVFYQMAQHYRPEAASGVRWDDPIFGIEWPILPPILSEKDAGFGNFSY